MQERSTIVSARLRACAPRFPGSGDTNAPTAGRSEAGFTLIELLIVVAVMPLIVGALALGTLSVFSLQKSVSNRLTDSGDAQVVSINFQNDVQSAALITTDSTPQNPAPCGSGFQILGLQLGNGNEISYAAATSAADPTHTTYTLSRYVCSGGSPTPTTSSVVARDLPSTIMDPPPPSQCNPPPATLPLGVSIASTTTAAACGIDANNVPALQDGWVSTLGVTGVTFKTTAPGSNYTYQAVGVPAAGSNSTNLATVVAPSTGCGFATPGTGTYASTLCFVDFSPWNTQTSDSALGCPSGSIGIAAGIANTPFTLSFCMSVSGQWNSGASGGSGPITGQTSAAAACGVAARTGYNDITAVPLPTYSCPPGSEAFLGNNGFYTGVPGDPGLYTVEQDSNGTVTINHIQVLSSSGPATGWELVTGDAESTDTSESVQWTSDQKLSLIPNTADSPIGNSCMSTGQYAPPSYNPNYLTGVGTKTVNCSASASADKTGTTMLEATMPQQLTVVLNGGGLQAMFLGVLLP